MKASRDIIEEESNAMKLHSLKVNRIVIWHFIPKKSTKCVHPNGNC